jgi:dipeptidyl aminopeptidase/acylaminoacyl peptidase
MISKSQHKMSLMILLIALLASQSCAGITTTVVPTATTVLPSSTSIPVSTQDKPNNQLDLSQMNVNEWASTSPDGEWVAVGLIAFPKENIGGQLDYTRLMIFSTDGKTHWTIIDRWEEMGLGFPVPMPLKWSQDGKHFYFTHHVIPDGCSAFALQTNLQRVNLEDGTVNDLLPDPALALALSPDDSQVAYFFGSQDRELVLRNLVTGEEREAKIDPGKDFNVGNILWSPDGKSLALTLAINPCTGEYGVSKTVLAESTTILSVDAKTLQQKVLIEEDQRLFITWEWNRPGKITITDGEHNSVWYLNVNTGEITRE